MEQFDLSAWRAERLSLREQSKRAPFRFHPGAQTDLMNDRTPRFIAPGVLVAYVDRGIL